MVHMEVAVDGSDFHHLRSMVIDLVEPSSEACCILVVSVDIHDFHHLAASYSRIGFVARHADVAAARKVAFVDDAHHIHRLDHRDRLEVEARRMEPADSTAVVVAPYLRIVLA